jgi:hypothetical protein
MSYKTNVEEFFYDLRKLLIFCLSCTLALSFLLNSVNLLNLILLFTGTMIFPSIALINTSKTLRYTTAGYFIAFGLSFGSPFLFIASLILKINIFTDIVEGHEHLYEKI